MTPTVRWPELAEPVDGPLAGVRVLDLTAYAVGPWALTLLASLGANVVKVEPPSLDHIRQVLPTKSGRPTTYGICNLGKQSIGLDLKAAGHAAVLELVKMADLVVENSRAGAMTRLGLDYESIAKVNPQVVYCSSSSFGNEGPMATVGSIDPHGQAFSGFVSINGAPGGPAEFMRYYALVDLGTATYLAQACLVGLHWRARNGRGCNVTTSQLEGALAMQVTRAAEYLVAGRQVRPLGTAAGSVAPSQAFKCRDGRYLNVTAPDQRTWAALCLVIGQPELAESPPFATNADRVAHRDQLSSTLAEAFAGKELSWWRSCLSKAGIPSGENAILDDVVGAGAPAELVPFTTPVPWAGGRTIRVGALPWRSSAWASRYGPAIDPPGRDQEAFFPGDAPLTLPAAGATPAPAPPGSEHLPLSGLRVVDLSEGVSGPYCGWLMACAGADVTKVERPGGDYQRRVEPPAHTGDSASFVAINSGKTSLFLEGSTDQQELAHRLGEAHVVIADRFGGLVGDVVGETWLKEAVGPDCVVLWTAPVAGEGGLVDRPATELEVQGLSGLLRYLGQAGGVPVRVGADVGSVLAGSFLFISALASLLRRGGAGGEVEVSAVGSLYTVTSIMIAALDEPDSWEGFHCLAAGFPPETGVVTTDGPIAFTAPRRSDAEWVAMCEELGAADLGARPEYATDKDRTPKAKELNYVLSAYTRDRPRAEVLATIVRHQGMAVPVQPYEEVFAHPQLAAIDAVTRFDGYSSLAPPWRVNGSRPHPSGPFRGQAGMSTDLAQATVLVTGANRGLGRAIARAFADRGARRVYGGARQAEAAAQPGVTPLALDVTDHGQVAAVASSCADVNVVVDNPGVLFRTSLLEPATLDTARQEMEVNYFGTLAVCRAFAPVLEANGGGTIVNVISVGSWFHNPAFGTYVGSKSAEWALTNALRVEAQSQGISVMAVHSGFIDTDMARDVSLPKISPEDLAGQVVDGVESGALEVLADERTRAIKAGLSDHLEAIYPAALQMWEDRQAVLRGP